jgi:surface polysaccharide O-acyltransferase-like enzyme
METRSSSEPGVNAFRFVLMFTVVYAHACWLFAGPLQRDSLTYLLLVTAHCSVPSFFITSGYFLRWRDGDPFVVTRWAFRKLLPLYLIWMAIYAVVTWLAGWGAVYEVAAWLAGRGDFFDLTGSIAFGVTTLHLWFLPTLALALSATSLSLRFLGVRLTWVLAAALAAAGLFAGTYQMFLGLESHSLRGSVLTAPLLVLIGICVANARIPRRPVLLGIAVLVAYFLQLSDNGFIATAAGYSPDRRSAVTLSTIPFALSVFLFARSLPCTKLVEWLAGRKHYLLVIYCIHPMILTGIRGVWDRQGLASTLVVTIVAFSLSVLAAMFLSIAHRRWRELAHADRQITVAGTPDTSTAVTRG